MAFKYIWAFILILCIYLSGCATSLPATQSERILYRDLQSLVVYYERTDWVSDQPAYESLSPRIAEIICQTSTENRVALSNWINNEINLLGGPGELQWKNGRERSDLSKVLRLERIKGALDFGAANLEQCPFWLTPSNNPKGVHQDFGKLIALAESMGSFQLIKQGGEYFLGGAGQGRILAGYGLGEQKTLLLGLEIGGASTFPRNELGQRQLQATWAAGIPIVFRQFFNGYLWDIEAAALGRYQDGGSHIQPGIRAATAFGARTIRIAGFQPHVMVWVGYENFFGDPEAFQVLRAGTRVGVSWSPRSSYQ